MATPTFAPCRAPDCGKPGTMSCPTCKELGAHEEGSFCSQPCFKAAWEQHKLVHKRYKQAQAQALQMLTAAGALSPRAGVRLPKGFDGYSFTGKLRPGTVSPMLRVPAGIAKPDYAETGVPASELAEKGSNVIPVNGPAAVDAMREVCRLGREVLDVCARALKPGVTGDEIDRLCFAACVERGLYPSPLNYHGFPKSLCTSVNEVICHGIPDSRPLEDGDIINLDISVFQKGFHADLNETYVVSGGGAAEGGAAGPSPADRAAALKLVRCAYECLQAAVALCRPGTMYRDVGAAIQKVATAASFSVVKSYCGHGVGKLFHTAPNVPHYAKNKAVGTMKAGHIFTIEPMINEGVAADDTWPDDWTAVTVDGKRSAQFEHTLLVTETGVEILTARVGAPRDRMVWDEEAVMAPFAEGKGPGTGATIAGTGAGTGAA
jgi:methionyl aminopeptidase